MDAIFNASTPKNKNESTDLFARGLYGNNVPTYVNPMDAIVRSSGDSFTIRYKGQPGVQGPAVFSIHTDNLGAEWDKLLREGWETDRLYVNDSILTDSILFQGELSTGNWTDPMWLLVGCEDSGIHMREAMKRSTFKAQGWKAREYLRKHMDWSSWDDLNLLIDMYPDGIIELVIFSKPHGRLSHTGRRAIFWEVRNF